MTTMAHVPESPAGAVSAAAAPALLQAIDFGLAGNSAAVLGEGWSHTEAERTWSIGPRSTLLLEPIGEPMQALLEIDVLPLTEAGVLDAQRLAIEIGGAVVASVRVGSRAVLGFEVALPATGGRPLRITFRYPDAATPLDLRGVPDRRMLALFFRSLRLWRLPNGDAEGAAPEPAPISPVPLSRPAATASDTELMLSLESIGYNCELGMVQRAFAAEPLALFRFATTPIESLIALLDDGLARIGDPAAMRVRVNDAGEYIVHDTAYGTSYHTWIKRAAMTEADLMRREVARLRFLRRKLLADLEEGDKLFVYKWQPDDGLKPEDTVEESQIMRLSQCLRRHGANTLLWVAPHERYRPSGLVEPIGEGLIKAYSLPFFHLEWERRACLDTWREIARQTVPLWQAGRRAA